MSVKGTGTVRTETQANIQTNTSNLISGDDVQEAIVNALDSLSKDTYVDTIPYEIGESVIFDDGSTKKIYVCVAGTTPGESPSTHPVKWTDILETVLGGDVTIGGNLIVEGDTVVNKTENVLISDNHLFLNNGYKTVAAQTGGLVVNYLPTATTDTIDTGGFTAGVAATSNPTAATVGAATFSVGDFIQIDGADDPSNNGLFEVLSHAANILTIRGIGTTARVEDFTQNQFVTDTTVSGTITKVNVSVLRAGTDGAWETASGSSTGLTFSGLDVGFGTEGQIPYTNSTGTDFDYLSLLKYDSDKNAFTAGYRIGTVGTNSVVLGGGSTRENIASGSFAVSFGYFNSARGNYSTAFGYRAGAGGTNAVSFGNNTNAGGEFSTAFGRETSSIGDNSIAFGRDNTATGENSTAYGYKNTASGNRSAVWGIYNESHDMLETVLGRYNIIGTGSSTLWNDDENLFTIGNGTFDTERSNALQVKKNGNTTISGTLEAKQTMHIAKAEVLYTNTTQTTIVTLPANAVIWDIGLEIVTTFNDSGTDLLDVGVTGETNRYVGVQDISSSIFKDRIKDGGAQIGGIPERMAASTNITFTYTGQNSDATQGQAFVYIHYSLH